MFGFLYRVPVARRIACLIFRRVNHLNLNLGVSYLLIIINIGLISTDNVV